MKKRTEFELFSKTSLYDKKFKNFFIKSFASLSPTNNFINNWHIDLLCEALECIFYGKIKRLIVCMPPRYMKSLCISTAFPAWALGNDPSHKIIVASYAMPLAEKLSIDTRTIIEQEWFAKHFPNTALNQRINSKRKFATNMEGFRLATSVNGSLTGEGCDILIADDPQKPLNIENKKYRDKTFDWLSNTFFSRLNNKKQGKIVIVMQRLHEDDIIGRLTENKIENKLIQKINNWHIINLPAIAKSDDFFRKKGEALNEKMEDIETLGIIEKQMGNYYFNAQYQQSPQNAICGFLKKSQMKIINEKIILNLPVFISIDSAFKSGENNDFTAISIWQERVFENKTKLVLVDFILKKLEFNELIKTIRDTFTKYNVCKMLIEDKASGISIIQNLQKEFSEQIVAIKPINSKEVRFLSSITYIESGDVVFLQDIPENVFQQLLIFPNGKHDDAVDSISQMIMWYFKMVRSYIEPTIRVL